MIGTQIKQTDRHIKYKWQGYRTRITSSYCGPSNIKLFFWHKKKIRSDITVDFTKLWSQKFRTSLRSSQVCCEVQKFIMRFTNQFVNHAFDWLLLLHRPIRDFVYKLACEFQYELPNFATNLRTLQRSSEHLWSKFREIDCKGSLRWNPINFPRTRFLNRKYKS